jgi:hypothetical protein
MVLELEDVVQSKAIKLGNLVARKLSVGQDVDLHHAFRAVSIDVITEYGFNKCYDLVDQPDLWSSLLSNGSRNRTFFVGVSAVAGTADRKQSPTEHP